jgi:hypothetical protein
MESSSQLLHKLVSCLGCERWLSLAIHAKVLSGVLKMLGPHKVEIHPNLVLLRVPCS